MLRTVLGNSIYIRFNDFYQVIYVYISGPTFYLQSYFRPIFRPISVSISGVIPGPISGPVLRASSQNPSLAYLHVSFD